MQNVRDAPEQQHIRPDRARPDWPAIRQLCGCSQGLPAPESHEPFWVLCVHTDTLISRGWKQPLIFKTTESESAAVCWIRSCHLVSMMSLMSLILYYIILYYIILYIRVCLSWFCFLCAAEPETTVTTETHQLMILDEWKNENNYSYFVLVKQKQSFYPESLMSLIHLKKMNVEFLLHVIIIFFLLRFLNFFMTFCLWVTILCLFCLDFFFFPHILYEKLKMN